GLLRNRHGQVLRQGQRDPEGRCALVGELLRREAGNHRREPGDRGAGGRSAPGTRRAALQACLGRERRTDHHGHATRGERRNVAGERLRGYDRTRFAGDSSVVENAELDVAVGKFNAALPFRWGLTGLADVGRVLVAGESSSKWHTGYGGGLSLGVFAAGVNLQFASAVKATVVHSDEGTSFYLFSGFSL